MTTRNTRIKNLKTMKKITSILLITISIFFLDSCDKAEEETTQPNPPNTIGQEEYVKCKIDGIDFLSKDDDPFNYAKIISLGGLTVHQLRGADEATEAILLGLYGFDGVGVYDVANPNAITGCQWLTVGPYATYDCNQGNAAAGITPGTVEVTFHSAERIEGIFEFTAINTGDPNDIVTITEGEFRLNY